MLGHGVHSAVFGFTFGAYVCSIVPVIKVNKMNIRCPFIHWKEYWSSYLGTA